jgi:phage tail sheath protein FI
VCEYGWHREVKQVDEMEPQSRTVGGPIGRSGPQIHIITGVPTGVAAFVGRAAAGPVGQPVAVGSFSEFQTNFCGLWQGSELPYAVEDFFNNGGQRAVVVRLQNASSEDDLLRPGDYLPAGGVAARQGLYALEQVDAFNLLVLSPDRGPTGSIDIDRTVIAAAATYCEQRLALLLIDAPASWTSAAMVEAAMSHGAASTWGTGSSNAALFFPRIHKADPLAGGATQTYAPSGAVAGVISHTDASRGVWKAPAGTAATIAGVSGVSVAVNDAQNASLQGLGVNGLRTFPQAGTVVWGARTLAGSDKAGDQFRYIPVRRTALFLEQSLRAGLAWVSFQPNNEALWSSIRLNVGAFLNALFLKGAFQGPTAQEAYFVRCDASTITQADVAAGIVNLQVGFAPLKPAEFVILSLQLIAASGPQ